MQMAHSGALSSDSSFWSGGAASVTSTARGGGGGGGFAYIVHRQRPVASTAMRTVGDVSIVPAETVGIVAIRPSR